MEANFRQSKDFRRQVLVVDDEFINREILGNILNESYEVLFAENGQEALEVMRENIDTISIVMLDLLMPEMDGFKVLKIRNEDENLKKIPVIVLTSDRSAEIQSLKMGASDFIKKPYDMPEAILVRVHRIVELSEERTLINLVEEDSLTGLYTKEFFFQYAQNIDRYVSDLDMDMILIDVNRFHLVNELYGREFGQEVLRRIGKLIQELLKDTIGYGCRSHADVFYVYCKHRDDYNDVAEKFQKSLAEISKSPKVGIRMGIYPKADKNVDIETCADRAKVACNTIRKDYTKVIAYYDLEFYSKELYCEKLMDDIHTAIAEKQFIVYYQPQYYIQSDEPELTSAEALVRWNHPEYGMISPGDFIPLFENNGLIQMLDNYVWKEVAEQIRRWKDKFGIAIPISVNVSRMDIYDPDLEKKLLQNLANNGLTTDEYMLEITESAYSGNAKQLISVINSLRSKGFKIEMDDFGTGYSSLNMLTEIPLDLIKLDMKFVKNMNKDVRNKRIIELITDIAKFLKLPLVAEGVEDESQFNFMKNVGCDYVQGYYFSKPIPPDEFERFIEDKVAKSFIS